MHSTIEILAYRTIGVIITVNLQHNLPKWVCVVVFISPPHPHPTIVDIWFKLYCSVLSECGCGFKFLVSF